MPKPQPGGRGPGFGGAQRPAQAAELTHQIEQLCHVEGVLQNHRRIELGIIRIELVRGDDDDRQINPSGLRRSRGAIVTPLVL